MDRFILSQNHTLAYDDDCLNHNVCVVGSPGSGKSSCYEMVNIAQGIKLGHSLVITDTKGDMLAYFGNYLKVFQSDFFKYFLNSVIIVFFVVIFTVILGHRSENLIYVACVWRYSGQARV